MSEPTPSEKQPTNVAIACQGGGSHTAFTAGALMGLFEDWEKRTDRLVAISGTSGGAFNALAAWYGLVTGTPADAVALLASLWDELSATGPTDRWTNEMTRTWSRMRASGIPLAEISPYQLPGSQLGKRRIRRILDDHIDFDSIPDLCTVEAPELVVGTVNVNAGEFETFVDEEVTPEAVLASAAVPNLFEAVEIDGHYHWDGLFSQNPPVRDLMHQPPARKPDELWVIQINPQEFEGEPETTEVIADRRNELSGNISLNQEIEFIEQVNQWIEAGKLPEDEFRKTEVHRIDMGERFHCSTKLDRDPAFIEKLIALGNDRAESFLNDRKN